MRKRPNNYSHRLIWERANNKKIPPGMHIHHVDGNPLNNNANNLILMTPLQHFNEHLSQGDFAACVLLSKAANVSIELLADVQRQHGLKCAKNKVGFHKEDFDHSFNSKKIWKHSPPGRKPVTNGQQVLKFKSNEEVEIFLANNKRWRKGVPDNFKLGLRKSKRRFTSNESTLLTKKRLEDGTHNFLQEYMCPWCSKKGKGPMMKRWHFNNCKKYGA